MKSIESKFNDAFTRWGIRLPPDSVEQRKRGRILRDGWAIWYLFGSDEKGEYLDYYASHRMTNDRHVRIHADGHCEGLPAISGGFRLCSEDPEENTLLETQHFAENQRVARLLEEKGFGLEGDEPGGVQINRFLHLERLDE